MWSADRQLLSAEDHRVGINDMATISPLVYDQSSRQLRIEDLMNDRIAGQ